jgi:N-acetyl sugar amidotransferase
MTRPYRECVWCVMDTSDPEIRFDDDGRCHHCAQFEERRTRLLDKRRENERMLDRLVDRVRVNGHGHEHDCILGISGGVDSSFAAIKLKELGLRPLVVHVDNGWNSAAAVRNIAAIVEALELDYESAVLDWEEFRDLQLAFFEASVPEIETPTDIAILASLHDVARERGIRCIVSACNQATEAILPPAWHYDARDVRYLRGIHERFGRGPLRTFPTLGYVREGVDKFVHGIRMFYLLDFIPYARQAAMDRLSEVPGWQRYGGKHHESTITAFVQSYVLPTKFGFDYRRCTLSTQICMGQTTREQALSILCTPPYDPDAIANVEAYVAKKFGITQERLVELIERPPRTHRDYPNDEQLLSRLYDRYRRYVAPRIRMSIG